jgi:hypothetical protein
VQPLVNTCHYGLIHSLPTSCTRCCVAALLACRSDSDEGEESSPYTALVSGPCWSVPLKPSELSDFVGMLSQLRLMVANLAAQGQWHGGSADRPASRVKVRGSVCDGMDERFRLRFCMVVAITEYKCSARVQGMCYCRGWLSLGSSMVVSFNHNLQAARQ